MKIRTETRIVIDCDDFDELVKETYGRPYCFQQQDDCKGRGNHDIVVPCKSPYDYERDTISEEVNGEEMGVSFKAWLARDPKEWNGEKEDGEDEVDDYVIDLFWARNFYPSVDMVINDLFEKGLIDAGKYTIVIDW